MGSLSALAQDHGRRRTPDRGRAGAGLATGADCSMSASTLPSPSHKRWRSNASLLGGTVLAMAVWGIVYWHLQPFSLWAVARLPIQPGGHLEEAVGFFI